MLNSQQWQHYIFPNSAVPFSEFPGKVRWWGRELITPHFDFEVYEMWIYGTLHPTTLYQGLENVNVWHLTPQLIISRSRKCEYLTLQTPHHYVEAYKMWMYETSHPTFLCLGPQNVNVWPFTIIGHNARCECLTSAPHLTISRSRKCECLTYHISTAVSAMTLPLLCPVNSSRW